MYVKSFKCFIIFQSFNHSIALDPMHMTPPLGYLPFSSVRGVLSPLGLAIIDYDRWLNRDGSDDDDSVLVTIAEPDHVERAAQACTLAGYHCWSAPRRTWPDEDAVFQLRVTRRRGSA